MKHALRLSLALALLLSAAAWAKDRPHEGKIARVDPDAHVIAVQGEKGDTWDLYVSETTKMKNNVVFEELQVGDSIHFDFVEKEGRMIATELRRTHKAKD